jgi:hypothetical protein
MCSLCPPNYSNEESCRNWKLYESCTYSHLTYWVDNPATVFFSIFMAIWTVLFIEFWKRKQSKLQFEWDTGDNQKKIETVRPEFELKVKTKRKNPVTLEQEPYVKKSIIIRQYFFSAASVLFMVNNLLAKQTGT